MEDQTPEGLEKAAEIPEQPQVKQSKLKRFFKAYWRKKRWTLPVTELLIIVVLLAVPITRFLLVGWFWREDVTITVYDSQNHSRVTQATVKIDGKIIQTDKNGQAKLDGIHIGTRQVTIEKKYYKSATNHITIDVFDRGKNYDASLQATGRLGKVTVTNRISGIAVEGALINAGDNNQARTDEAGVANVIMPADKPKLTITITANNYTKTQSVVTQNKEMQLQLTPTGKMFFLSKASGKIDVVKTNYDGTD